MRRYAISLLLFSAGTSAQPIPPIQQFDATTAIRTYLEGQRVRAEQQNAQSYARQTDTFSENSQQQFSAEETHQAENVLVGQLIAAGRCADARRVALGQGRFDLVDRVVALCEEQKPKP